MVDNCKHVSRIKTTLELGILCPERWQCNQCGTTESVWACLLCQNVACGRYNEEHALQHYNKTKHPLCIEVNEKFVFCYECDDFILNDNAPGDLKLLRMALDAVAAQNFEELSTVEGGTRILRSSILNEPTNKSRRLLKADHVHTALVKHRVSQLSCFMRKWYSAFAKKRYNIDGQSLVNADASKKSRNINFQPGITGLRNLGNTCYMNSVLQILSHTAAFSNFIVGHNPSEVIPQSRKFPYVHQTTLECFEVVDSPGKKAAVVFLGSERLQQQQQQAASTPPNSVSSSSLSSSGGTSNSLGGLQNAQYPTGAQTSGGKTPGGGLNGGSSNIKATEALTYASEPAHSLYEELHALFRVLWSGKRSVVSPHSLLYAIWVAVPAFKGYKQQDAQEFLSVLLDKLQSELHPPGQWRPSVNDFITRAFQGRILSRVTCSNFGHVTTTEDPFLDLSLAFPAACQSGDTEECSLRDMLSLFVNETPIDGRAYACKACNRARATDSKKGSSVSSLSSSSTGPRRRNSCGSDSTRSEESKKVADDEGGTFYTAASQTLRIARLPKVLRLHLKRFRWMGRQREKLCCHVNFPQLLDLSDYVTESCRQSDDPVHYQLTGVTVHHGRGFQSGHYTAYCLNDDPETWLHCNDANVTTCTFEEVADSQAYILVYSQLVPHRDAPRTPRAALNNSNSCTASPAHSTNSSSGTVSVPRRNKIGDESKSAIKRQSQTPKSRRSTSAVSSRRRNNTEPSLPTLTPSDSPTESKRRRVL